ncbi:TPA: protein papJ, partial [Escherichia coli]
MVVNKTTAVLYLIALSLSGFIHTFLRAEERGIYDDVFTADELHHYRINERGGRTGSLAVSGALLSSPCTLVSNEVPLSLRPENHSASAGAPLMLRLAGCGDGGALQPGKRGVAMTV